MNDFKVKNFNLGSAFWNIMVKPLMIDKTVPNPINYDAIDSCTSKRRRSTSIT